MWAGRDLRAGAEPAASCGAGRLGHDGEVPGRLHGWFSTALGDWLGCSPGLDLTVDRSPVVAEGGGPVHSFRSPTSIAKRW